MKLGFVSAILPDLDLEQVLQFAHEQGFACVELMCWPTGRADRRYAGVTHLDVANLDTAEVARIRGLLMKYPVEISGLGYYPNPLSPDEAEAENAIEHLKKVIAAAALLHVPVVNTFVGRDWTKSVEENWPQFVKVWPPLVELADKAGVRIAIENCPMIFSKDEWPGGKNLARSPVIWKRMFAEIPSFAFGLNYDPSHMLWQFMDHLQPLRDFAGRIFHTHAKDIRIDHKRLDEVGTMALPEAYTTTKLPGLGDIDWAQYCSVLGCSGYQGAVCIEVEDRVYEGSLAGRKAALIQSARYLRNFLPEF